jgi:hypothetical protein
MPERAVQHFAAAVRMQIQHRMSLRASRAMCDPRNRAPRPEVRVQQVMPLAMVLAQIQLIVRLEGIDSRHQRMRGIADLDAIRLMGGCARNWLPSMAMNAGASRGASHPRPFT